VPTEETASGSKWAATWLNPGPAAETTVLGTFVPWPPTADGCPPEPKWNSRGTGTKKTATTSTTTTAMVSENFIVSGTAER
jgi:hypothetical protein